MRALGDWPPAPPLETERLSLEPLRVAHADEMADLLDDERLHRFIGGEPRTLADLRDRYRTARRQGARTDCSPTSTRATRPRSASRARSG